MDAKVIFLGDSSAGKTKLVNYIIHEICDSMASPTLGATYASVDRNINGIDISFQLWDTAGQEKYHALGPIYYRGADAAVLVYSLSDVNSFNYIDECVIKSRELNNQLLAQKK